jgi:predicted DNA-binding protein (UPF0278 family)
MKEDLTERAELIRISREFRESLIESQLASTLDGHPDLQVILLNYSRFAFNI